MSEVKRYFMGSIEMVTAAEFDRVTAERDATMGREAALKEVTCFKDAVACVFDNLKMVACNTDDRAWDDRLEDLAEDVIEMAPEYKKQWKDICRLTAENHQLQQRLTAADERADVLETENKRLDLMVSQGDYNYDADRMQFKTRIDELEGLLRMSLVAMRRIYLAGEDRIIELGGDCDSVDAMMESDPAAREIRAALKPAEDRNEPNCLLCLDKKTVPSNLAEGYLMDCPDCCSEEG